MVEHLIRRIKADAGDEAALLELGVALAGGGNLPGFTELLTFRHNHGGSGSALAFDVCCRLIASRQGEAVLGLSRGLADHNPFSAAVHSAAALVHFLAFDNDRGVALMREGVRRLVLLAAQLPSETLPTPTLTKLVAAAFLCEPLAWRPAARLEPAPFTLLHPGSRDGAAILVAAFGDSLYVRTYAGRLVDGFHRHAGAGAALLIGIVNPDAEAAAFADELTRRHPALAVATVGYGGDRLPEFCCSARFLFAETLLELGQRPLILTDIDSSFPAGSDEVLRMVAAFPLAHIRTRDIWPQLLVDASVVGAHPGPAARAFFAQVNDYVRGKLLEFGPLWTHDQVALHRAIAAFEAGGGETTNVNSVLPARFHLPAFFKSEHALPLVERQKTRSNDRMALAGIGDDLKPLFVCP